MKKDTILEKAYNTYFENNLNVVVEPRLDDKVKVILKYVGKNNSILDIGCLTGYVCHFCIMQNNKAVGIDFVNEALNLARRNGIDARYCNIETNNIPIKKTNISI